MPDMLRGAFLAVLLSCAALACAAGGAGELPDGAADSTVSPPMDGTATYDQNTADALLPDTAPLTDTSMFDGSVPDSTSPPPEAGPDAHEEAGKDAEADVVVTCGQTGKLCNYEAQNCTGFFACYLAYVGPVDGGDGDAGAFTDANDGVCLSALIIPKPCNDGGAHCPAGEKCLNASEMCLKTATEIECVCDNPETASACGPP
jgi:hypothetical protein